MTLVVYATCLITWISFEVRNFSQGYREWNRILAIAFPATVYAGGFLFGTSVTSVLFPIVFGHGIGYMAMMSLTLERTRKSQFATFAKGLAFIAATALACGGFEYLIERDSINFEPLSKSLGDSLVIGLYLVPLFSHFLFDRFLWRRDHWESKLVYRSTMKSAEIVTLASPANSVQADRKSS